MFHKKYRKAFDQQFLINTLTLELSPATTKSTGSLTYRNSPTVWEINTIPKVLTDLVFASETVAYRL